ncbi:MAG: TonB C-terminal domain-containing protein [Sulfurimonas sp.]|uniref:TonB C-terminal domain-containing protein n=1 Tax=Sulfurimonas sp. TaxID=2022749 RepID=UPI00261E1CE0|nr:TonB C-terminal domain-containing protein [Sulfurimonas sp.]MCW8894233.1 TonB C-terminal domain-containing protein [Sulfurimonas sp.]MCW8954026.1 TonB C-terminal domain-containing protein [Sulfurimonas sp.]MCW9067305.1 TonB C-terminal domain-containing protein [Sulfurimonas sp.]
MDRNNSYFYISGFISLSLFAFFLSLFFFMIYSSKEPKFFALKKDNFISVSVDIASAKKSVKKSTVQKTVAPIEKKEVNIDNLFDNVWTQGVNKTEKKVKKVNNRRLLEIQKKISTSEVKNKDSITDKIKNIDKSQFDDKGSKASTATEVNEYLAKIQALVYEHFYPPQNSQGNSVEAVIELSAIGKVVDFRILRYSTNSALNSECDNIKDRLLRVVFPEHPQNSSGTYTITLTSKE